MGYVLYDPYGEVVSSTLPAGVTDRLFTGYRWDGTLGLYDANARFYDPATSGFTQMDSLVADPLNPRAWNRSGYVYGNPANYTDSTGHFIDTLWDAVDLATDVQNCLGDSDALSCYMLPVDIVSMAAPFVTGASTAVKAARSANNVGDAGQLARRMENSCAFNSFPSGTVVHTEEGLVPVEEVQLGDKLFAQDPETGETGYFEVVNIYSHPTDELVRVSLDEGNDVNPDMAGANVMDITPGHPVYIEDKGWVIAENLTEGDRLRRADGGWATVLALEQLQLDTPQRVYNFTVQGIHTYFVLEVGVLVHNCRPSMVTASNFDEVIQIADDIKGANPNVLFRG